MESHHFTTLATRLDGELHTGSLMRGIYATDASAYQETPQAVAIPQSEADLVKIIRFASEHKIGIIPRTAGTSLAGQVVGNGIIVDVSKHFTDILEINPEQNFVRVQPTPASSGPKPPPKTAPCSAVCSATIPVAQTPSATAASATMSSKSPPS
jgi:hypothetical protein